MGITEVLTIIFIILKLIGKIDWSWALVLLPELISFAVYAALFALHATVTVKANRAIDRMVRSEENERW